MADSSSAVAGMLCPTCKIDLVMSERQGIEIDYCPKCRGVWLDRGELDKIIEKSAGEEDRSLEMKRSPPKDRTGYEERREPVEEQRYGSGSRGHHGSQSKHGSFLRRIFD